MIPTLHQACRPGAAQASVDRHGLGVALAVSSPHGSDLLQHCSDCLSVCRLQRAKMLADPTFREGSVLVQPEDGRRQQTGLLSGQSGHIKEAALWLGGDASQQHICVASIEDDQTWTRLAWTGCGEGKVHEQ